MTKKEYEVYQTLQHWNLIQPALRQIYSSNSMDIQATIQLQSRACKTMHRFGCLLKTLSDDERFVVEWHLIQGASWSKTFDEYQKSRRNIKSISSLRRIQANALSQIAMHL